MRLLIITQKIDQNDPVLGFFVSWVKKISEKFEKIQVICLEKGEYNLPKNVSVSSLGKENRKSKTKYIWRFYKYIWQQRKNYDVVFVHMNQEYVLLGGLLWKIFGKKVAMWRNHYAGSFLTQIAGKLCDEVYYTSPHSFTATFKNAVQMPVGVDTDVFKPKDDILAKENSILFVGRMSPVKKPDVLLEAEKIILKNGYEISGSFYGNPDSASESFYNQMLEESKKPPLAGKIIFYGGIKYDDLADVYRRHKVFVNLSPDGMFDKTIFEAMSSGALVLVSNSALKSIVPKEFFCDAVNPKNVAERLKNILDNKETLKKYDLRKFVIENHSLDLLAEELLDSLSK